MDKLGMFGIADDGIDGERCYVCNGQKKHDCDYVLIVGTSPETTMFNFHYYHSSCVADQLLAVITENIHRDEHSEQQMNKETLRSQSNGYVRGW